MKLGPLKRIVLLVRDFDRSLAFFRDALGLELAHPVRPGSGWATFDVGGVLLCLKGPWPGMNYELGDFGRSPDELLFLVPELDEARSALVSRGVAVQEPHTPAPGLRVAEFADPDGRRFALEERR